MSLLAAVHTLAKIGAAVWLAISVWLLHGAYEHVSVHILIITVLIGIAFWCILVLSKP